MSSRDTAFELGQAAGLILFPVLLVAAGFFVANRINRNREFGDTVRWPIAVGFALAVLGLIGQCAEPRNSSRANTLSVGEQSKSTASDTTAEDEDHVVEVIDGRPEAPLPDRIDAATLEGIRQAMSQGLANRYGSQLGQLTSQISAERFGARTILRHQARATNNWLLIQYIGVVNGRRKVVSCAAVDGIEFRACRERAIEQFGPPAPRDSSSPSNG